MRATWSRPNQGNFLKFSGFPTCGGRKSLFLPTCDGRVGKNGRRKSAYRRLAGAASRKDTKKLQTKPEYVKANNFNPPPKRGNSTAAAASRIFWNFLTKQRNKNIKTNNFHPTNKLENRGCTSKKLEKSSKTPQISKKTHNFHKKIDKLDLPQPPSEICKRCDAQNTKQVGSGKM